MIRMALIAFLLASAAILIAHKMLAKNEPGATPVRSVALVTGLIGPGACGQIATRAGSGRHNLRVALAQAPSMPF